ncbi:hypothetical protein GMA19_01535 [Paenibacillus polymyxa E681]|uniref:hypothetical protein n=1 Tax=Paenibacillus polymyxa TaxID=1406 RepID=UPI0005C6F430|nr:hypothetical protein [Paenibacillus polymyxa]AJW69190.1 hypothetical protein PPE_05545 [Paenibacillus polymyxa E681]QNV56374.1 hypothetical protein GE561_01535 [Paenibacillus polymyxa E681]QNV61211.1 hypothetical protein GMA19_01535 [Paenibacillus polymyxa E681]
MKRQIATLLMSTSLVLSLASVASAESSSIDNTSSAASSEVQVINLGTTGNDAYLSSSPQIITDDSNSVITPMSTDGQNISYSFKKLSDQIFSSSPLPVHRYGNISLTVVQDSGISSIPADVNYQFLTKDYKKKSSVVKVYGNVNGKTITFSDVPQGTASNPVYLLIGNHTGTDGDGYQIQISGNGYTN